MSMTTPPPSLKPCPFCGGEAVLAHSHSEPFDLAACLHCHTQGPARPTRAEAITAWNNRASDTLEADVAALREALEGYARNYLLDEYENPDLCYDDAHRAAVAKLFTTLERTAR